jgi:hypothetical protein
MGDFSAVFANVDDAKETDLGFHRLSADTLTAALAEACGLAPQGTSSIRVCQEGVVVHRLMVGY